MRVEFDWERPISRIANERTGGNPARLFLANEAKKLMEPYVPAQVGSLHLAQNVRTYVENGEGIVEYLSPYAHYQYEGELYVDPKTEKGAFYSPECGHWSRPKISKVPTGKKLKYSTFEHPLATSHWDKAMKTARGTELARAYQDYLGGGR